MAYVEGKTNGKADKVKLQEIFEKYAGGKLQLNNYVDNAGKKFENFFLIIGNFVTL